MAEQTAWLLHPRAAGPCCWGSRVRGGVRTSGHRTRLNCVIILAY